MRPMCQVYLRKKSSPKKSEMRETGESRGGERLDTDDNNREKYNVDWNTMNPHYKYGSLLKRETFEMAAKGRDGEDVVAQRSRVITKSFDITFSKENVKYVMNKYANV